jgi:hypothetical protein
MATKATTIKLADLGKAVQKAVAANTGTKRPGPIIMGIILRPPVKFDANAAAKSITKEVSRAVPGVTLTPKVVIEGGVTTMGFIFKPTEFEI